MKGFLREDYFLNNNISYMLYKEFAENKPIIDYHCHLSAREIYENKPFESLYQLWLKYDHYKWRLMRQAGIDEYFITGKADEFEKFASYCKALSGAVNNPLYIWSHLELRKYFGIDLVINEKNAYEIWNKAQEILKKGFLTPLKCMEISNVKTIFTTDDALDDLRYHKLLSKRFPNKVLPAFRGDKALGPDKAFIEDLQKASGIKIACLEDYLQALYGRLEYFCACGAKAADFSFECLNQNIIEDSRAQAIFEKIPSNQCISDNEIIALSTYILYRLSQKISELDMVMELHMGVTRNKNKRLYDLLGVDCGCDGISEKSYLSGLYNLLNNLNSENALPHIILFNLNPNLSHLLSVLAGCLSGRKKIQLGPSWWFNDNKEGIISQLDAISLNGHLGSFAGMLTDSRSFLSYSRHDYFRRILCDYFGEKIQKGEIAFNKEIIGEIIENICFKNAQKLFRL